MSIYRIAVCLLLSATLAGCGIGFARGGHSVAHVNSAGEQHRNMSFDVNHIMLFDESGILVSAGAQAHEKWTARKRAAELARLRGKKAGQRFSYNYRRVAPALGARSRISIMFGSNKDGIYTTSDGKTTTKDLEMSMFGLRWDMGLKQWEINEDLSLNLELAAIGYSYSTEASLSNNDSATNEPDSHWGTPVQLGAVYRPIPSVSVAGIAGFDPLFSLFSCMGDACQPLWNLGAEANWKPLDWLGVVASGRHHKTTDFNAGMQYTEWFVGAYVMWEPEFWRRAKTGNYGPGKYKYRR